MESNSLCKIDWQTKPWYLPLGEIFPKVKKNVIDGLKLAMHHMWKWKKSVATRFENISKTIPSIDWDVQELGLKILNS